MKFGSWMLRDLGVEMTTETVKSILSRVLREHYEDTHRRMAAQFNVSAASVGRWFKPRPSVPEFATMRATLALLAAGLTWAAGRWIWSWWTGDG